MGFGELGEEEEGVVGEAVGRAGVEEAREEEWVVEVEGAAEDEGVGLADVAEIGAVA